MNTHTSDLAVPFLQAHNDFLAAIERYDETQWQAIPADDPRSVGCLAHHVASGYVAETTLIKIVVEGQPLPAIFWDQAELDRMNATEAEQHHACTKEEAVVLLRQNAAATLDYIQGLSAADLSRSAHIPLLVPWFGETMSVRQMIEVLLPTHIQLHLSSMRRAIGDT